MAVEQHSPMEMLGSITVDIDSAYDLGTTSKRWANIFADVVDAPIVDLSMTRGSVLFIDANGRIAQDNANLFWDDASNFLRLSELRLNDNANITFGTGQDATIDYDGTNLVLTPDVVGSGVISLNGEVRLGSHNTATQILYIGSDNNIEADSEFVWNTSLQRLGVATSNPQANLDVAGTAIISGTLTLSSLTQGSVVFVGSGGVLSQDNTNYFWDNSNKDLKITHSFTGTVNNQILDLNANITTTDGNDAFTSLGVDLDLTNSHKLTGTVDDEVIKNTALDSVLSVTASHSANLINESKEQNTGQISATVTQGTLTGLNFEAENVGARFIVTASRGWNNAGGTYIETNTGLIINVAASGTLTAGTLTRNNYGSHVTVSSNTGGTTTNYGHYISGVSGADTNWAFYNNTAVDSFLGNDNAKTFFGTGQDASIRYDGTDLLINPREVGSGNVEIEGALFMNGVANEIQLLVQGHSTQTANIFVVENSSGTDLVVIDGSGDLGIGGTIAPFTALTVSGTDNKDAGPIITLLGNTFNQFESGRIRFQEQASNYQGAYIHYDGSGNKFIIGMHNTGNNSIASDIPSIVFTRSSGNVQIVTDLEIDGALNHDGSTVGFYGTVPVALQTGVAVTSAGIHAALVNLGLIT